MALVFATFTRLVLRTNIALPIFLLSLYKDARSQSLVGFFFVPFGEKDRPRQNQPPPPPPGRGYKKTDIPKGERTTAVIEKKHHDDHHTHPN